MATAMRVSSPCSSLRRPGSSVGGSRPASAAAAAAASAAAAAAAPTTTTTMSNNYSPPLGFPVDDSTRPVAVAVMGDLHLAPAQMPLFHAARDDLRRAMGELLVAEEDEDGATNPTTAASRMRLAQLGDLGAYECEPGTVACFRTARNYLQSFQVPFALVTGNHDVEAHDVETDEQNLQNWRDAFAQRHYWAADVGPATFVGLSTVRFRSNAHSVHEVYVDDAQVEWFDALLSSLPKDRPVVVLTHAPPQGCGLKAVQAVHVRNRCAWLCHSDRPRRFLDLVERHAPRVRLWFSGHFHLSQQYPDSVSVVGSCAFVQTGVAGECHRDGFRQSRLLKMTSQGYELYTVDHTDGGRKRLDLKHRWEDVSTPPVVCTPAEELLCDPDAGWLCSRVECDVGGDVVGGMASPVEGAAAGAAAAASGRVQWFPAGGDVLLALQDGLLVEYDLRSRAPVGLVAKLPAEAEEEEGGAATPRVQLLAADGSPVDPLGDGADAAVAVIYGADGSEVERVARNEQGGFFRIFQPNKWRLKKEKEAAEKRAEAAVAPAAVNVAAR
jgi:3',5'-cyclic AMP phosphodiesterase CpdA